MPSTKTQRPTISICTQKIQEDVPGNVHSLLLSSKQMQELLQRWSVGEATEGQVSDAYVKICTDFSATVNAFKGHNIDLTDIHSVPQELRAVLEVCLSEDQSPQVLEQYMPEVRRVLYRLLKGLQSRQDEWRAASARMP
ncbi:hypothetical protein L208DRAFT_1251276 [Tricholoma matsutake]|nr:hypothetical protein L208DRAFT_1251276 [Tricholoma matsutake 945]